MSAAFRLRVEKNGDHVRDLEIVGPLTIGRGEDCGLRLEDRAISRDHAVIEPAGNVISIVKKSQFAPVNVNGSEVDTHPLKNGDVIGLGPFRIIVSQVAQSQTAEVIPFPTIEASKDSAEVLEASKPVEFEQQAELAPAPIDLPELEGPVAQEHQEEVAPVIEEVISEPLSLDSPAANPDFHVPDLVMGSGAESIAQTPVELPGYSVPSSEPTSFVEQEAKTKFLAPEKLTILITFKPGDASVTEYVMQGNEVSLGRHPSCDIVINDKKASRKHAVITREGSRFFVRDQNSANGISVNGAKVTEAELLGDDILRIGEVEFHFAVRSSEYRAQESEPSEVQGGIASYSEYSEVPVQEVIAEEAPRLTGLKALKAKYESVPRRKRLLYMGAIVVLIFAGMDYLEELSAPKTVQKISSATPAPRTYEALDGKQRKDVDAWYQLAFQHLKNQEWDNALFEVRKIFVLIDDYRQARDIERQSMDGKRRFEALQEEKRKKEEEEKRILRLRAAESEAGEQMKARRYDDAQALFPVILSLDPENQQVPKWQALIDQEIEAEKIAAEQKRLQEELLARAKSLIEQGKQAIAREKFYTALKLFKQVVAMSLADPQTRAQAEDLIRDAENEISNRRDPLMAKGREAETAGDLSAAFKFFDQASKIDPHHSPAYQGMERVRGALHLRAKSIYTEAVLAENFSEFDVARKKFEEILEQIPESDEYFAKARSKLSRYHILDKRSQ